MLDDGEHRGAVDLALRQQPGEYRGLQNAEPDVEPNADQNETKCERDTPAPGQELLGRHLTECEHREISEEKSAGNSELRPRRNKAAECVAARPFHRHQYRTAPFAADAHALDES